MALALSLVGSACGARVAPYLGASGQGLGGGGSAGNATGANSSSGGSSSAASTGAGSTGSGSSAAAGSSGSGAAPKVAPASSFSFTPQAEASACTGTTGNTASAPGVTTNAIQIGNVSGLSGPLSGSFNQPPQGVQALFDAVNAAGGICGRQLQLTTEDDGQNSSTNGSDALNLINKPVFAFAGSTSDADDGMVPYVEQYQVPDFGFAINCDRSQEPEYWSVAGGSCYQTAGGTYEIGSDYFLNAQQGGYLPKKMAVLAYSIAISAQAAQQFAYVLQHDFGVDICYEDTSISPVSASLESDVEQMQANGCQGVVDTLDVTGNAKLLQALQQQNVSLQWVAATFDVYTPILISTAGESAAQGMTVALPFAPLEENGPMAQMYQQQLSQYVPGAQPSGFGYLAWLATQMMIYALLQQRNPTRASVTSFLNSLQNYTAGGAVGPHAPSTHTYLCTVDVEVKGNGFVPRNPTSGLFCGGSMVAAS
ncbi:MAG TPA: ABC transporter substrate-binding protein [Acidimicrobiales bacterium]|nr:ABC transporter substrate-binding protein [Acidimicrobiales bacterium]